MICYTFSFFDKQILIIKAYLFVLVGLWGFKIYRKGGVVFSVSRDLISFPGIVYGAFDRDK